MLLTLTLVDSDDGQIHVGQVLLTLALADSANGHWQGFSGPGVAYLDTL